MIEYIYFVKCPNCDDEHFSFFDEARDFALSCLSAKPIITQTEVNRNDFGECTDSNDLGAIWSWEDVVKDVEIEPEQTVFSKSDTFSSPDVDAEFDALDNSLDSVPDNFRKPIPDGMTIKDLVEAMEENEDEVECTWCEDLFEKSECRYEVNLGWLCDRCQAAIMSRGEPLTFRENNYWDFLDEDTAAKELTWRCFFDDCEVGTVTAKTEDEAAEKMQQEYPEYNYGLYDGCFSVELQDDDELSESTSKKTNSETVDLEYEDIEVIISRQTDVDEWDEATLTQDYTYTVSKDDVVNIIIENFLTDDDIEALGYPGGIDAWYGPSVDREDPESAANYDKWWEKASKQQDAFIKDHFDTLFNKYEKQILEYYEEYAIEACEEAAPSYSDYLADQEAAYWDSVYDSQRDED